MKQPIETDFAVERKGSGGAVVFKPTNSTFTFNISEPFREVSVDSVRHGKYGDTGEYRFNEVLALAQQLAAKHVKDVDAIARGCVINFATCEITHQQTATVYRIEKDDVLTVLFDPALLPEHRPLFREGANEALRQERERQARQVLGHY